MTTLFSAGSDSSLTQITYIEETTPGVTPTIGSGTHMKRLRVSGETLQNKMTFKAIEEMRDDGNITDLVLTALEGGGDFTMPLIYANGHDLFESALRGAITANALKNGVARKSFTVQVKYANGSIVIYRGVEMTGHSIKFTTGSEATVTFNTMCRSVEDDAADLDPSATAATLNPVYDLVQHISGFTVDGVAYTDGVSDFSLSTTWNPRAQRAMGSATLAGIGAGNTVVTGSFTSYFGNATALRTAAKNKTPIALATGLTAAGHTFGVQVPALVITDIKHNAGGVNQDVMLDITWQAKADANGVQVKYLF